jgi:hypothetical protein
VVGDHLVLGRGWPLFAKKIKLTISDTLVFNFHDVGFKVMRFLNTKSTKAHFECYLHGY